MFEAHVSHLLKKYLGDYVQGLSAEALRISVWKGDVILRDLQLKAEALNSLKLPVIVKAGFIGTITLKVPWKSLGKEPVIVIIDRVFILAHPAADGRTLRVEDRDKLFQTKLHQIDEAESTILEAKDRKYKLENASDGNSWLGSLIATVIGNLKISISNVHIRYEDGMTNPGHPFCVGITLAKLAAVTMDENGNETFDTSGALDKLRKSVQLQRLAMYHDPDSEPWKVDKTWMDLSPKEWIEIFEDGINDPGPDNALVSTWALNRKFLVSPINGVLKYHRLGKQERKDPDIPFEKASLVLSDVSITISEAQYYDCIKLLEVISRYKTHVDVSHLRPQVPALEDPRAWWHYAVQAVLQQKKMCYRLSWDRVRSLCHLRRRYVQLYANLLQQISQADNAEIRQIERDLDSKIILLWRLLAHAKVETVKTKEIARQKSHVKKSWWSFGWGASSKESVALNHPAGQEVLEEQRLTKEEWEAINKLLSYQTEEGLAWPLGKNMERMMQYLVNVSIGTAAARIINIEQTEILCGKFEQLQVSARLYPKSIQCDVTLKLWGLSSPEGSLVQSVSNEKKVNALAASFVYSPSEEDVDWQLSANIAPCHVTVFMGSYDRFMEFIKRSNAISPVIASETATALQTKLERVTRRAQEQFQLVLEEQSRFALDIDFDAPKVRVPLVSNDSIDSCGYLLLDFGHFTLQTKEGLHDDKKQSLYSCFYISGMDITAFFLGGPLSDAIGDYCPLSFGCPSPNLPLADGANGVSSLIDRFGALLIIEQIKVAHPSYPPTRVSVQVPNLAIHFSPSRYSKLLDLLNIIYGTTSGDPVSNGNCQTGISAWCPSDRATDARILVWTGIGNSTAEWRPCFLILSNLHLYALDSEASQTYRRCISMVGRQVFEVFPTSVGGSLFSIAVSYRGLNIQKALESSSTMIVEFRDDEEKMIWMRALVQATYKASAPPAMDMLMDSAKGTQESDMPRDSTYGNADLVVNGNLVTMKLMIYGEVEEKENKKFEETLIVELLANGGKVNIVNWGGDLTVNTKLHSLYIKDEFQSRLSGTAKYLACSVLKKSDDDLVHVCHIPDANCFDVLEEEDNFRDALAEFAATPDQSFCMQMNHEIPSLVPFYSEVVDGACNHDDDKVTRKSLHGEMFYEAQDETLSDFVVVTFLTRHPGSLIYEGVDIQMCIRMSKLEFYCNRATLVALTKFGLDLSLLNSGGSKTFSQASGGEFTQAEERNESNEHAYVRGLLGYGKDRVVFYLKMDVKSVCIYLNKEDGSQLAMLVQESFLLDLKIHPSSLSIDGALGNLRLCDMSLGMDHCWGWLCDLRNPGTESLIKFTFQSYNIGEDDYDGYDYSLHGRLSAVRIVFLYRFVQEIMAYFWELATPQTEEAIRLVDKVRGIEWLIQKYEIDGATALKLDLSLDTPRIIVPRNSRSKDFMQLDLGRLVVQNNFSWHGCKDEDPSAVHLDVLDAEVQGVNMAVGIEGILGRPMVREGQGLHIHVRRSLRNVFRKVPTLSMDVKVGLLHAMMSDKEYNVIVDCFYMNISEEPNLPPSFRGRVSSVPKETMRMLADKVNVNSQALLSRTVTLMSVEVTYALLELYNGFEKSSPLAHISLEGLWVSYRTTSLWETDIYITIPKFSVLDIRPDTKSEMRLMLGSSSDVFRQGPFRASDLSGSHSFPFSEGPSKSIPVHAANEDPPNLTMLLMDYKLRSCSQSFVFRIQHPHVLVVLDFLLAVGEFFVPALGAITGREEIMHPHNDPITQNGHILLSTPNYQQVEDIIYLSPNRKLIADASDVDGFVYDGCGGTICLSDEFDMNGNSMIMTHPIVIVGRGKNLRFKNVKFENGALLLKGTYLNNDSSYTVCKEDGVLVSYLDEGPDERPMQHMHIYNSLNSSTSDVDTPNNVNQISCFTFEAQVVSPEFTFYDSTNISMNDSLQCEKFLRAKMDINFMFASKEKDTWVRGLVKDLSIEAGSGLVVLDPVDISGGYTSVNDKMNISMQCTDICIHLPLSVISLVLHLQSEAFAALQIGNDNFLSACTNFDQIWSSGSSSGLNLCIWRPQPPSNYAILGDCVTFGPVPPSQAVMAVSNTYIRVRKALGFNLVGSLSSICGLEDRSNYCDDEQGCSLWMPIPPSGYKAVGCVAHIGSKPPPNHIVYCIRSDLVTSSALLDCILYVSPNPRFLTGFSMWHIENVVGTFYAHSTVEYPKKYLIYDLHEILRRNMNKPTPSMNDLPLDLSIHDDENQNEGTHSSNSSGWDVLRSISKSSGYYMPSPNFERIWWDKGSELRRPISIWRPVPRPGFCILGDCIAEGFEPPALGLVFRRDNSGISAKPIQFTKVAHISVKGIEEAFFWFPVAPPGYASLGCVVSKVDEPPSVECFCCLRIDLVNQATILDQPISSFVSSKASQNWSIWRVDNQANTFLARSDQRKPSDHLAYSIGDCVKPKTNENICGEMKLKYFSLTVLDDSCGMMTPFFDTTVTNLNVATYGRAEAMSAVVISSIAASTFNAQLEAWEPLIEPFDGIFKFESYKTNGQLSTSTGKRVRVAATSTVNANIAAANIEAFAAALISWRNQAQFRQKIIEDSMKDRFLIYADDLTSSALEETDSHNVVIENKMGCDIYLKILGDSSEDSKLIRNDENTLAWLPPPSFSDRFNVATGVHEIHCFVAVHVFESRGLTIIDDGNQHDFFCALRLVPSNQTSDQQKLFPQSARTRCMRPAVTCSDKLYDRVVRWNELFIFEVPRKGAGNLEVEVTNLGAKAGKGEVIGVSSIPISDGTSVLNLTFARMPSQRHDAFPDLVSYSLRKKGQVASDGDGQSCGSLLVSTSYFERKVRGVTPKDSSMKAADGDISFCVALASEGPWTSFRRLLPLSTTPKELNGDFFACDVAMKGKKHVTFRSLAMVTNDTDLNLEVCICPLSLLDDVSSISTLDSNSSVVTEEIFENQHYQPVSGWSSKWPDISNNDPGHWSTRDFSYSSKEFFEPVLPTGWKWISDWNIDKALFVDSEGWAYGSDFQTLKWPPVSSKMCRKSALDFVRRRRWIRARKLFSETSSKFSRDILPVMKPGSSLVLPWKSVTNREPVCLQVRPFVESSPATYFWTKTVTNDSSLAYGNDNHVPEGLAFSSTPSGNKSGPVCGFILNQLEKQDTLLFTARCNNNKEPVWFSVGTDASILQTELNSPVYDWRISLNPPLKLENKLPCHAEYYIWEKANQGSRIERQHGIVSPGCSALIYSSDVRKPIYLSWVAQGGWISEMDAYLILDPALGHVSSFWLVHQKNSRKLRVSVECDFGGTLCAPKTVRIFVPYWLSNDSGLPLSYQLVEVEPSENTESDTLPLSRVVKSAKFSLKAQSSFTDWRKSGSKRNLQILEEIEEPDSIPVMLSPHDYANHGKILPLASRNGPFLSPRFGIAVALSCSNRYSPGISLVELENKEHVNLNAFSPSGSYYKLSASISMKSDRTKVVHFRPHTVFINRLGYSVALKQCDTQPEEWIHPDDPPKPFQWRSISRSELLKIRLEGFKWSAPFSVELEGVMCAKLKNDSDGSMTYVRVEVRKGSKSSRYQVLICPISSSSPYRIENRSTFLPIRFRQADGTDDSWRALPIHSAVPFFWEDLGRRRLLEILIDGTDSMETIKCNIDDPCDPEPFQISSSISRALCVSIVREGSLNVVKFTDWMPSNNLLPIMPRKVQHLPQLSGASCKETLSDSAFKFHVIFELAELGLSIIDHTPEEIIYLSVQNLVLTYSTGIGSGISRFKLRVAGIQVDNQLPLTPMPVLFRHQKTNDQLDFVLKLSMTLQSDGSTEFCVYPYIGVQGPQGTSFLVKIHEPILWRLHEMFQKVSLSNIMADQTTTVPVDPVIQINLLNISEFRFKVSVTMSPTLRPRGVLGFWSSLMTALGNMENMPVHINQRFLKSITVRQSSIFSAAFSSIQKDLLSRPLQLLSGVDILGNASSALGNMSRGVAALSMDKKFIQSRQRQEGKGTVEDIGDVIREGGGALAKGLFRGVTGILTKPLEGAKSSGIEGFVQGVGKGIIGAAAQPVSGVLDLLSKTTEGANAVRMKLTSAITSEEQLLRRRLPRVISGDNVLRPYDEYKAQGQIILQLAESGTIFGQADLFKVRGKFALSDSYEDHFILPKGLILVVTHRRVLLLQQPMNILAQRKFNPSRDPCAVLWDVSWSDLHTMELTHGKKDDPRSPPSMLVLYLHSKTAGSKENFHVIKCIPESPQALEIYASIEQAMNTFGPNHFKMKKRNVKKPYSPSGGTVCSEAGLKEVLGAWAGQETLLAVPVSSTFGSLLGSVEMQSQSTLGKER